MYYVRFKLRRTLWQRIIKRSEATMDGPGLAMGATFAVARATAAFQFDTQAWLQLTILIISLILTAVASATETALTSVSRIKLRNLAGEGDKKALELERLLAQPNTFLSTILVVNSVAVIVASSMATVLALRISSTLGELISSIVTSLVVLIFCEITPKTAALQNPMRVARAMVKPVQSAAWLLRPVVWSLGVITTFLVRLLGGQVKHRGPFVTEEELRLLVTVGEEEGVLEEEETEMIHSRRSSSSVTNGPRCFTCPPSRRTRKVVITPSDHTTGRKSQAAPCTGFTIARATRIGFCSAAVFGVISQKINTTREVTIEEISSPRVEEMRRASTVAILEATITATLLTTRMVERKVFGWASKRSSSSAFLSPSPARFLSLIRLTEVSAVSVAEATAVKIRLIINIASCNQACVSN